MVEIDANCFPGGMFDANCAGQRICLIHLKFKYFNSAEKFAPRQGAKGNQR